jgi:hypothetical protein
MARRPMLMLQMPISLQHMDQSRHLVMRQETMTLVKPLKNLQEQLLELVRALKLVSMIKKKYKMLKIKILSN